MSKKILFLFFCVFALAAHSQNVVIKGSVTDVNKEQVPLPISMVTFE